MTDRTWIRTWLALLASCVAATSLAAQDRARFVTVEQGPDEFRADEILASKLAGLIEKPTRSAYSEVVQGVIDDADEQGTVARMTPYAFVVAEIRGAKLDLIATYESKSTKRTMYNAYLVVRRRAPEPRDDVVGPPVSEEVEGVVLWDGEHEPTLGQVLDALVRRGKAGDPARFVYHKKLSTSSFFLPSLLFRSRRIFDQGEDGADSGATMVVEKIESDSSSDLVRAVANGDADLASVWDGTIRGFQDKESTKWKEHGRKVWFVKLPTDLPCDLLVATHNVDPEIREKIRERLQQPLLIEPTSADASDGWDVSSWVLWADARAEVARSALSVLRRAAAEPPSPVVVSVRSSSKAPVHEDEVEAVRQAIRLSGTEFVARSEFFDYYKEQDVAFELRRIHDGAVRLAVGYARFKLDGRRVEQSFDISFTEPADLTRRVGTLIHSRLHRVRPIWLYQDQYPTVIRDVDFEVPRGTELPMIKINWSDPARNDFTHTGSGFLKIARADFNKFEFDYDEALLPPRKAGSIQFQPMGRTEYRVLLMRPTPDRRFFQALTIGVVALFVLALAGLVWDMRRTRRGGMYAREDQRAEQAPRPREKARAPVVKESV